MNEQIEPGDGYRLIDKQKDTKQQGDEYWSDSFNEWVVAWNDGVFHSEHVYRRRIPAKPEPIKIRHTLIKCNSFNDVMRATNQDVSLLVGNADEARQLADWLTRYADWREAQDSVTKKP